MTERQLQKNDEGDSLYKEAEKLVTKNIFRWKADWEQAGPIYERAATAYKNAKNYRMAKESFSKAAECMIKTDLLFLAAKNYESAALMSQELGNIDDTLVFLQKSATNYRISSNPEKSAEVLIKASKCVEKENPDKALEFAKNALEIFELDEKDLFSGQTYKYAISLCIRFGKTEEAIKLFEKQSDVQAKLNHENDVFKCQLSLIILHLSRDDYAAAEKGFRDYVETHGFSKSEEGRAAAELLDGFEKRDNEAIKKCTSKQVFTFLDNDVTKIAKKLTSTGTPINSSVKEEDINSLA